MASFTCKLVDVLVKLAKAKMKLYAIVEVRTSLFFN